MLGTLRSRLVLQNLVITLLGMLIIVVVFSWLLAQRGVDVKKGELSRQSQAVAAEVQMVFLHHGSPEDLQQKIDAASRLLGERIIVANRFGVVKVDSAHLKSEAAQFVNPAASYSGTSVPALQKNFVLFQRAVRETTSQGGKPRIIGAVVLLARPADLGPDLTSLIRLILIAAGTTLFVWLLIGFYFASSIFRPLYRITQATERMARGDYTARASVQGSGEIPRLASSFNDMAEQVQRTNQLLKDFVANVSHDLRTPLTMITGFSQALLDGTARQNDVEASATVIHEESIKMQHLVDDLLQLTRLESGLFTLDRHPVDVATFVENVVARAARARTGRASPLARTAVPEGMLTMDADAERLERALRNLVDNALEYTPPDGVVTVGVERIEPGWVEISVSDTGPGIPPDDVPRIFERFFRSSKSRDRAHGHSGLGLAIAREIIEAHGGGISVQSGAGGTTFRFTVPEVAGLAARSQEAASGPVRQTAAQ